MKISILPTCILLAPILCCSPLARSAEISGIVLDENKTPLPGVVVSAYRNSQLLARSRPTGVDGEFNLDVGAGPIDMVDFTRVSLQLGLIEALFDEHDQRNNNIIKLLYPNPKGTEKFSIRMSLLLDYESYYYYRLNPPEPDEGIVNRARAELARYLPLIQKLEGPEDSWTGNQKEQYVMTFERVLGFYKRLDG